MTSSTPTITPGLCSLSDLLEPYRTAFRQGRAHHLPGQFLPAQIDWFTQICMLPFLLMYASPVITLGPFLIIKAIQEPGGFRRFVQEVVDQSPAQIGFTVLLLLLCTMLIGLITYQAWDMAQSFYRTWDSHRFQRRGGHAYGLVLLSDAIVGRLVDNLKGHNCLWLPRQAIIDVAWRPVWEEGAKRSRWVHRTQVCYRSETGQHHWLTLKGEIVQLEHAQSDPQGDLALYDTLIAWWNADEKTESKGAAGDR